MGLLAMPSRLLRRLRAWYEGMRLAPCGPAGARTGRALRMCGMAKMSGSLIAPSSTPQGQPHSPAWSGCRAERVWPPEPRCGRRTSRRHSLLQEKGRGEGTQKRGWQPCTAGQHGHGQPTGQTTERQAAICSDRQWDNKESDSKTTVCPAHHQRV